LSGDAFYFEPSCTFLQYVYPIIISRKLYDDDEDVEVNIRTTTGKASSVFQRLQPIWKSGAISKKIKLQLFSSIVVLAATYACETWKTTTKATKMIDVFYRRCFTRILEILWRDHITNYEVMTRSRQKALHDIHGVS